MSTPIKSKSTILIKSYGYGIVGYMPRNFFRIYHIFFGILDATALIVSFLLSLNVVVFFFSYFTVLSNILITALFLYFGFFKTRKVTKTLEWLRGAAVLYMSITGIIYWTILVNNHSLSLDPWINLTLHGVMPIAALVSWFLFPPSNKLEYKNVLQWLILPLLFVFYTLVHGFFINWYPYPFLNPIASGSYIQVFIDITVILSGAGMAGLVLVWLGNSLGNKKEK